MNLHIEGTRKTSAEKLAGTWSFRDFCSQPDLSRLVLIEVCFIEIGGKDAEALRKEATSYYQKQAQYLTTQKERLEKEAVLTRKELVGLRQKAAQLEASKGKVEDLQQNSRAERTCKELIESQKKVQALEKEALDVRNRVRALEGQAMEAWLERSQNSGHAAARIQAFWRMFCSRKLTICTLAERRRRVKHGRELMAALQVQLAWRLYHKRLERRWRSKASKSQATPYDLRRGPGLRVSGTVLVDGRDPLPAARGVGAPGGERWEIPHRCSGRPLRQGQDLAHQQALRREPALGQALHHPRLQLPVDRGAPDGGAGLRRRAVHSLLPEAGCGCYP